MASLSRVLVIVASLAFAPVAAAQVVLPGGGGGTPAPAPAPGAQAGLITKLTAQQLVQILGTIRINGATVPTSIRAFNDGSSMVVMPFWGPQVWSGIILQFCEKDGSGCHLLHFLANVGKQPSISADWVNAFNASFYYVKALKLTNGELAFTYDIGMWPGVTQNQIVQMTGMFKAIVDNSFKFKPGS